MSRLVGSLAQAQLRPERLAMAALYASAPAQRVVAEPRRTFKFIGVNMRLNQSA